MYEFCLTENGPGRALAQNDAPQVHQAWPRRLPCLQEPTQS